LLLGRENPPVIWCFGFCSFRRHSWIICCCDHYHLFKQYFKSLQKNHHLV